MGASFPERHPTCGTCGAFLQEIRWHGLKLLRCPWARDWETKANWDEMDVIWCDRPIAERVVGGMSREAVRNV